MWTVRPEVTHSVITILRFELTFESPQAPIISTLVPSNEEEFKYHFITVVCGINPNLMYCNYWTFKQF